LQTTHDDRPTNTYVLFNVLFPTTSSTILDQLLPALTTASITEDFISHSIRFTGLPLIYNIDKKIAILMVINSLLTDNIKFVIRHTLNFSFPTSTNTPPHTHSCQNQPNTHHQLPTLLPHQLMSVSQQKAKPLP
jgi:hypothetical protein